MKYDRSLKKTYALLGFSLLELMVVVVLVAGLIAISIPTINALRGLDLKNEITKIAGLSSEVYALAAISGKTHRIAIDFDSRNYWVEEKAGDAGVIKPELGYEDLMKSRIKNEEDKEKEAKFLPEFSAVEGPLGEKRELAKGLVFYGAWTDQMTEVARSGLVYIYFFAGGYTQTSFLSLGELGDEENSAMYLSLSPLTGVVRIDVSEPDTRDLLEVESEQ